MLDMPLEAILLFTAAAPIECVVTAASGRHTYNNCLSNRLSKCGISVSQYKHGKFATISADLGH